MSHANVSHKSLRVPLLDSTQVGEARRAATGLGQRCGLDESEVGRLALVATEAATNIVRHGGSGELLLRCLTRDEKTSGVEALAIDKGPGIADIARAMEDGFSTLGSRGGGLGAIARMSTRFDLLSAPGAGTIVMAQVWKREKTPTVEVGAVCVPIAGETACGDDWSVSEIGGATRVFLADGLGHGVAAEQASTDAVRVFENAGAVPSIELLERVHLALRGGRGAAVAVAILDQVRECVDYAGVGNIAGIVRTDAGTKSMVSQNGTAGHAARRFGQFSYAWPANSVVVMHSDGLSSHWSFDAFPGLARRHPSLIAAALYRDFSRGRDDATVVVCRRAAELTR